MSSVSHTLQKYFDMCALVIYFASRVALVVKNPPTNAGDIRDVGSTPGLERFPGEGLGNPF